MSEKSCRFYMRGCPAIGDMLEEDENKGRAYMRNYCLNAKISENCRMYEFLEERIENKISRVLEEVARREEDPFLVFLAGFASGIFEVIKPYMWRQQREEIREAKEYEALKREMLASVE